MLESLTTLKNQPESDISAELEQIITEAGRIILGKDRVLRLALTCLLARGHLLIEDLPGVGKTTMAHVLAQLLGLQYQRIQFTSDLLPADIIGVSIFNQKEGAFQFHPGPVFTQLVLADEINRATPKAQSALLEAMEERQITAEGETRQLPKPFFVIATQNPISQIGTFPLPESQLDRFFMRLQLGYPNKKAERTLLAGEERRELLKTMKPVITPQRLLELQGHVPQVHVSDALLDYCQDLLEFSRTSPRFHHGLSPRAGLALLKGARAWALLDGRYQVLPEDLQAVLPATVSHRLHSTTDTGADESKAMSQHLLESVAIP
ncbi:FIG022979: MoxR-like ATPases [hydrothermal vent metagenome]|uniref:FIG022979: MoxR-like ATPases n=1 Tax=hydrothermal vent metagenome TaxID=652676 RepID=A0A3B1B5X9_9ZZZZ